MTDRSRKETAPAAQSGGAQFASWRQAIERVRAEHGEHPWLYPAEVEIILNLAESVIEGYQETNLSVVNQLREANERLDAVGKALHD